MERSTAFGRMLKISTRQRRIAGRGVPNRNDPFSQRARHRVSGKDGALTLVHEKCLRGPKSIHHFITCASEIGTRSHPFRCAGMQSDGSATDKHLHTFHTAKMRANTVRIDSYKTVVFSVSHTAFDVMR